jgi:hypothetical protein
MHKPAWRDVPLSGLSLFQQANPDNKNHGDNILHHHSIDPN